jgi:hypothetical protein
MPCHALTVSAKLYCSAHTPTRNVPYALREVTARCRQQYQQVLCTDNGPWPNRRFLACWTPRTARTAPILQVRKLRLVTIQLVHLLAALRSLTRVSRLDVRSPGSRRPPIAAPALPALPHGRHVAGRLRMGLGSTGKGPRCVSPPGCSCDCTSECQCTACAPHHGAGMHSHRLASGQLAAGGGA